MSEGLISRAKKFFLLALRLGWRGGITLGGVWLAYNLISNVASLDTAEYGEVRVESHAASPAFPERPAPDRGRSLLGCAGPGSVRPWGLRAAQVGDGCTRILAVPWRSFSQVFAAYQNEVLLDPSDAALRPPYAEAQSDES